MHYQGVVCGTFSERPNRFIAYCTIDGQQEICHVKNTGRCRELLVPGCRVYLQKALSPTRKTPYDLIAVDKGGVLFNIDSQAPNKVAAEWLPVLFGKDAVIRPEYPFGHSRLDFMVCHHGVESLVEVKGVTLEQDGIAYFPDAPTKRGAKHLRELTEAAKAGRDCTVLFVLQMENTREFRPNRRTDPDFACALAEAAKAGVRLLAYDCLVTPDTLTIRKAVPIILD